MISPRIQHPTTTTTTAAAAGGGGLQRWNSPIPYLFGGIALMLGAIALALIILACSYRNSSSTSSSSSESSNEKSEKHVDNLQAEAEHRIVVIMAGETNPTHLAKPIAAAAARRIEEQV